MASNGTTPGRPACRCPQKPCASVSRKPTKRSSALSGWHRCDGAGTMVRPKRAITLVLVLLTLTLAAALIVPLADVSGTQAVSTNYRCDALRHKLAAHSLVALLPQLMATKPAIGA